MKALTGINILLTAILILAIFSANKSTEKKALHSEEKTLPQIIYSVDLNEEYNFAGEPLPLEKIDVKERLDREMQTNSYWHSTTLHHLKYAGRYFPIIDPILTEEGIPYDFKYLAVAESSFKLATSPSGAKGIWQFMERTAEAYGLIINGEVDERYHLEKSTRAACRLLHDYKDRFGSWTMAAAAYNIGETKLAREMEAQQEKSYYDLNVTEETMRYIFRIVAIKEVMESPEKYGYYLTEDDIYKPLNEHSLITVDGTIESLADFAHQYGATYRDLKVYSPWLRTHSLINRSANTFEVKIPPTFEEEN